MAKKELTSCTSRQPESERITPAQLAIKLCGEARVGLGCMGLTGIYGAVSPESAADTLHAALDAGIMLFDTAALYASGANEEMLGKVLGRRRDINVVTKFGLYEGANGALLRDSRPSTIRASVEASLRRLRRDRLDLVLQHRPDPAVPDHIVAETVSALIKEGKVAAFGLSGKGTDRLQSWPLDPPIIAVQNELSLATPHRQGEPSLVMASGAVFMTYAPLGRGLLTGSRPGPHGDLRLEIPGFQKTGVGTLDGPMSVLKNLAERLGTPQSRIALAWLLAKCGNVIAIPGCRSRIQVEEIMAYCNILVSQAELAKLDNAI